MFEIGSDQWPGISKLTEEAGEVLQICGKLMGSQGEVEHWDGTNLRDELTNEMGDLLAAIQFVVSHCDFNPHDIATRADKKLALFEQWHAERTRPPALVEASCTGHLVHDEFTACPVHDR